MTEPTRKTAFVGELRLAQFTGDARHSFLFFMYGMLNAAGFSKEERIQRMRETNSSWCSPPVPGFVLYRIQEKAETAFETSDDILPEGDISEGGRGVGLSRIASRMREAGLDYDELLTYLLQVNERLCKPPLGEEEVERICQNICRYEAASTPSH